jgi:hypothetical protein
MEKEVQNFDPESDSNLLNESMKKYMVELQCEILAISKNKKELQNKRSLLLHTLKFLQFATN